MEALVLFLFAAGVSFIGSLQAGVVNTAVLAHTVKRGPEAGRRMAIGGAIPELLYAGLAFQFSDMALGLLGLDRAGVGLLVGSILIGIGLYFLILFKPRFEPERVNTKVSGVRKGLLLGLANPQLLLFWSGMKLSLTSFGFTDAGSLELVAFAFGAFVGAVVLLLQLVRVAKRAVEKFKPATLRWMFRAVGMLLILVGVVGIMRTRPQSGATSPSANRSALHTAPRVHTATPAGGLHAALPG